MVTNALTFDIEDYYHSFRPLGLCPPDTWMSYERRVEKVTHQLLDTLDTYELKATCFVNFLGSGASVTKMPLV